MRSTLALVFTAVALLACTGVTDSDTDSDTDPGALGVTRPGADGCPFGPLAEARVAKVQFARLNIDGADQFPEFDPAIRVNGTQPAACVDDVGRTAVVTFAIGGQPYGFITLHLDEPEGFEMTASTGKVAFDLFGALDPVIFDDGAHWSSGGATVESIGSPTKLQIAGRANRDGRTMYVEVDIELTP